MTTTQPPQIKPHQPTLYVDSCPCQDCVERRNMAKAVPGVRYSRHEGWYVPTLNGKDLPITTFDESEAWRLAVQAISQKTITILAQLKKGN